MKWTRAVHHLAELGEKCAEMLDKPRSIYPLRVVRLWAYGQILGAESEISSVRVALEVDLPAEDVPWLSVPSGAEHWANATRMAKNPLAPIWRSAHAPVWNHHIVGPALVWDAENGIATETLAALREGNGESVRSPQPEPAELRERIDEELAICLRSLRDRTRNYGENRWTPGKLAPRADQLFQAADGYLDLLDAAAPSNESVTG